MYKSLTSINSLNEILKDKIYKEKINTYLLAYEAWIRGLEVSFVNVYNNTISFKPRISISNKKKEIKFNGIRPSIISKDTIILTGNRGYIKELLKSEDISISNNVEISNSDSKEEIIDKINKLRYPTVIFYNNLRGYRMIKSHVMNEEELLKEIKIIFKKGITKLEIEEHEVSYTYKAMIINNEIVGIVKRATPNVIGDGSKTLNELIKETNKYRNNMPKKNSGIRVNNTLKKILKNQGFTLSSIPIAGQLVKISKNNSDYVEAFNEIPERIQSILMNITSAIDGLHQSEVTFLYNNEKDKFTFLKIETKPSIIKYLYPISGNQINLPKYILDYYFPESKENYLSETTPTYFFDLYMLKEVFVNYRVRKISLPKYPYEPNLIAKRIKLHLSDDIKEEIKFIKRQFSMYKLNGEIFYHKESNNVEAIISGNGQDISYIEEQLANRNTIINFESEICHGPVKVGYNVDVLS